MHLQGDLLEVRPAMTPGAGMLIEITFSILIFRFQLFDKCFSSTLMLMLSGLICISLIIGALVGVRYTARLHKSSLFFLSWKERRKKGMKEGTVRDGLRTGGAKRKLLRASRLA